MCTGYTRTKTTSIFFTSPFSLLSFFLPPSLSLPPSLPLSLSLLPSLLPTAVTCSNFCFLFSFSLTLQCLASGKCLTVRGYYNYWKIYTANLYTVDHSHSLCTQDLHWTTHSTGESSVDNHMEHYRQHSQSVWCNIFVTFSSTENDFCTGVSGIGILPYCQWSVSESSSRMWPVLASSPAWFIAWL